MMIGAIATVAFLAVLASVMATLSNQVIAREFPTYVGRQGAKREIDDFVVDQAVRLAKYQQAATLFHFQSLILWTVLAVLLAAALVLDLSH
jgi:hypothetical protein